MKEIREMQIEELEARSSEIVAEIEGEVTEERLKELDVESLQIEERKNELKKAAAEAQETRNEVAEGKAPVDEVKEVIKEERKMTNKEVCATPEYRDAFANYIRTGDDKECRALLTENVATGVVPVASIVYDIIKNAWEKEGVMSLVEISADGAVVHTEGAAAPTEEKLVLGIVELVPQSLKKWITISDEVLDMDSTSVLEYVYDEVAYQIAKKAADTLIAKINACGTVSTNTPSVNVSVPVVEADTISLGLIASAIGKLSDQAANPVIMMNKATWSAFKSVQYAADIPVDPFEGLPIVFNNSITAFSAATTGVTYAIVGDLGEGAIANFPNGEEITMKFDDLSLAESDLVKIVGREFVALGVIGPDCFVKITKASA